MAEIETHDVKELLVQFQGQEITLDKIRHELQIERGTKSFDSIRNILLRLSEQKIIRYISKGTYKVIQPVQPVSVFGVKRERRPVFPLVFPRDFNTGDEMDFAYEIVIREGDMLTVGGVKSKGKTTFIMNLIAENIEKRPVIMGNEYTIFTDEGWEPSPRFFNRMEDMSEYVDWVDENGEDKFTLLPVHDDYAEHIIKDRLNAIDWINIEGEKSFNISKVLEGIKRNQGRGVTIAVVQKNEAATTGRGGQFLRDFSDVELLLDGYGENEDDVMLTVKGAKEKKSPVIGKRYAYTIVNGIKIINFREIKECKSCYGQKFIRGNICETCDGIGYIDKEKERVY